MSKSILTLWMNPLHYIELGLVKENSGGVIFEEFDLLIEEI